MRKAVRAAFAALFVIGMSAVALPAQAEGYGATVSVDVSDITVFGGQKIRIRAEAKTAAGEPVQCAWKISFRGASAPFVNGPNPDTGTGSTFNKTYGTDRVSEVKRGYATASCTYDDETVPSALGGVGHFSTAFANALQTAPPATGEVNLRPRGGGDSDSSDSDSDSDDSDDNGGLPDTGGERMLWLLIGVLLLVGGATVVVTSRDRGSAA